MSVKRQPPSTGRSLIAITCAAFAALLVSACSEQSKPSGPSASGAAASSPAAKSVSAAATALTANACVPTGAHDKHAAMGYGCTVCHPCGGGMGFGDISFPGGDSTAGGTITANGPATTCSVGCHSPLGAPPQPVAWNHGPLQCADCHSNVPTIAADTRSSHFTGAASITSSNCTACHDQSQHTSGLVTVAGKSASMGSAGLDALCLGCHGAGGRLITGVPITIRPATITRTVGSFLTDGYQVGGTVTVTNSAQGNNGTYAVIWVTATQLTLRSGYPLVSEYNWFYLKRNGGSSLLTQATLAPDALTRPSSTGSFAADGYAVGGTVTVAGASNAGNNGTFTIAGLSDTAATQVTFLTITISSTGTITRPSGNFVTDGYVAGGTVTVGGTTSAGNFGTFNIAAVSATQLTLAAGYTLTTETKSGISLRGASGSAMNLIPGYTALVPETSAAVTLSPGPQGQTVLQGSTVSTPPLLVGWTSTVSDTTNGDFHGGRRGTCYSPSYTTQLCAPGVTPTGFGGTIKAPYYRGNPAIHCQDCHDGHSSKNAFLLASTVNGTAILPGTIDRAGVGAQNLCNACHQGDRHAYCKTCHTDGFVTDDEGMTWFDPNAPAVDPMPDGSACFYCHGHGGLSQMANAAPAYPNGHPFNAYAGDCSHCHSNWWPPATEYAAPAILQGSLSRPPATTLYDLGYYPDQPNPQVLMLATGTPFNVSRTSASIYWESNEPSTTYVEYGIGTPGLVAGYDPFLPSDAHFGKPNTSHRVDLTGLTAGTTYVWRIRSNDRFHNVTETPLQTFRTLGANDVQAPAILAGSAGATVGTYSTVATLVWAPAAAGSGTHVQYEVQVAIDANFSYLANASLGAADPSLATGNSGWIDGTPWASPSGLSFGVTVTNIPQDDCGAITPNYYYWRVRAKDALGNVSPWSTTGSFWVFAGDPNC